MLDTNTNTKKCLETHVAAAEASVAIEEEVIEEAASVVAVEEKVAVVDEATSRVASEVEATSRATVVVETSEAIEVVEVCHQRV